MLLVATRSVDAEPLNVAPGSDPGGSPVSIVSPPFSLGSAAIQEKLARDGEGVAIGWDFSQRPKSSGTGTHDKTEHHVPQIVTALIARSKLRLVPAFVDRLRPSTLAQAIAFIARTPARIVIIPFATNIEADWIAFRAAAEHFPNLLFVVPAQISNRQSGENDVNTENELGYPAKFHLPNVLSVSTLARSDADVILAVPSKTTTSDVALAVTVKALLFCTPTAGEIPTAVISKLEALAKLGTLHTPQTNRSSAQGPSPITPCADALN